ncbi:RDD family protein [Cellulomonas cellasea]|uniref:Putative RDD family membrane protein YckC n=1 Tax=Cellulomonas cellasea TaxID=43670 RepID=A0A7W4UCF5_9CELL|nr:RDD family protein [Cellulomonas cellasea]MBB2921512.1 putative RDD family membrane protein YckC [Cellulomonas cellasea]
MEQRSGMGSWLEGGPSDERGPGSRLGLPATGAGSQAPVGRRLVALAIDWAVCLVISAAFLDGDPMATLGVFALENVLLVSTLGTTLGHRALGLRVQRLARPGVAPGALLAAVRTVLLCLVVPAVVWDADGRGLHDRAAGTVIVRR